MNKSTALTLGVIGVSICLLLTLMAGVAGLLQGQILAALFYVVVFAPILYALYITFAYVKEQIDASPPPRTDVSGTPWEHDSGHTEDPY